MSNPEITGKSLLFGLEDNAETVKIIRACFGKTIKSLKLDEGDSDNALHFEFTDGTKMKLFDNAQSCCELRYMRTDDDLKEYIGARLLDVSVKSAPEIEEEAGDFHEVQFLEVDTSKGILTMSSHNLHNGYYGGFDVVASEEK